MDTFTGVGGGIGYQDNAFALGVFPFGNTFTGVQSAINVGAGITVFSNNTVTSCPTAIAPNYTGALQIGGGITVNVTGNTIKDNAGYSVKLTGMPATLVISGNNFSGNAQGFFTGVGCPAAGAGTVALDYWGNALGSGAPGADVVAATSVGATNVSTNFKPYLGAAAASADAGAITPATVCPTTFDFTSPPPYGWHTGEQCYRGSWYHDPAC